MQRRNLGGTSSRFLAVIDGTVEPTAQSAPPYQRPQFPLVCDLGIVFDTSRICSKQESILAIIVSVTNHTKAIGVVERSIAAALSDDDLWYLHGGLSD